MYSVSRKAISIILCIAILICVMVTTTLSATADAEPFSKSAIEFVSGISAGWNLGNTLEACYSWTSTPLTNPTPTQAETAWGNPVTTQAMIDKVAATGFNAIRIPVSWYLFVDEVNGTYTVDTAWLARVKQIVDYAYKDNMYVIINMHHDDGDWLNISKTGDEWTAVKAKYQAIWQQVATYFKDYDEKLIFEAANEIIYNGDWWGQSTAYFDNLNELYQIFDDTVRATGSNNSKRYLMLPTYGAQWYEHQYLNLKIPNNDNHVIVDIHWYNSSANIETFTTYFSAMYNNLISKGIPVVMGECGMTKSSTDTAKVAWANSYVKVASSYGIKCFLWDDGGNFQILVRRTLAWNSTAYVNAVIANATTGVIAPTTTVAPTTTAVPTTTLAPTTTAVPTTTAAPTTMKIIYGDLNNDTYVNAKDVLLIKQYIAQWNVTINLTAADVNVNGTVNAKDALLIKEYIAGYQIVLGK